MPNGWEVDFSPGPLDNGLADARRRDLAVVGVGSAGLHDEGRRHTFSVFASRQW